MKQSALIILLVLVISSAGLAVVACSGSTDEDVTEIEEQSGGSVEIMGRVEGVEGSVLTLATFGGIIDVMIDGDSSIQKMCQANFYDITVGKDISVMGRTDESGAIDAMSITLVPDSMASLFAPLGGNRPGSGFPGGFDGRNGGQEYKRPQALERPDGLEGFPGGESASGTIREIEGDVVTVSTVEGTIYVLVGDKTLIQNVCEGSLSDITINEMVTVSGSKKEDGSIKVKDIFIIRSPG